MMLHRPPSIPHSNRVVSIVFPCTSVSIAIAVVAVAIICCVGLLLLLLLLLLPLFLFLLLMLLVIQTGVVAASPPTDTCHRG